MRLIGVSAPIGPLHNVANVIRLPASVTNASVRMNPDMSHLPDNILYLPEDQVLDAKEMEGGLHFQIVSP